MKINTLMLQKFTINKNKKLIIIVNIYFPLFFAGLVGIYLKSSLLNKHWISIARMVNEDSVPIMLGLGYFSQDIFINLFLIPSCVITIGVILFKRMVPIFTIITSCLLIIFYFIQLRVQDEIGQYASATLLYEAALFAMSESTLAIDYINGTSIFKLFFILFITILTSLIVYRASEDQLISLIVKIGQKILTGFFIVSMTAALLLYPEKSSGLHQAAVYKIYKAMISEEFKPNDKNNNPEEHLEDFRVLTNTPKIKENRDLFKSEKNSNVLYFIMETGPASNLHNGISELIPSELVSNSLIAKNHHTTYPYTSDSLFSLLSGFYPEGRRRLMKEGGFKQYKSLFSKLNNMGYVTGAYVPSIYNEEVDEQMLNHFGFNNIFVSKRNTKKTIEFSLAEKEALEISKNVVIDSPNFQEDRHDLFKKTLFHDLYALEKMKADMLSTIKDGKTFANIYLPQIGHGPWFKIGSSPHLKEYGRALMKIQSAWLKDIVKMLKDEGVLNKTIIVLTSDHGVRTKAEDLTLEVGKISSYSFHIPLMVYSPSGFKSPIILSKITSHIDIDSSISLLLGLESDNEGTALWEPSPDRRVYFFSTHYGGAEGFYDGQFFMNNVITDIQYKNTIMEFPTVDLILLEENEKNFVLDSIEEFRDLHRSIILSL